jgi:hypothetical protein
MSRVGRIEGACAHGLIGSSMLGRVLPGRSEPTTQQSLHPHGGPVDLNTIRLTLEGRLSR